MWGWVELRTKNPRRYGRKKPEGGGTSCCSAGGNHLQKRGEEKLNKKVPGEKARKELTSNNKKPRTWKKWSGLGIQSSSKLSRTNTYGERGNTPRGGKTTLKMVGHEPGNWSQGGRKRKGHEAKWKKKKKIDKKKKLKEGGGSDNSGTSRASVTGSF